MRVRPASYLPLMAMGLLLFVALAMTSTFALGSLRDLTGRRAHARETVISSAGLVAALVDIETGQRGYLLTGERDYLRPYHDGLARHARLLKRLELYGRAYPTVRRELVALRPLVKRRVELARRNIAIRNSPDFDPGEVALLTQDGLRVMRELRRRDDAIERSLRGELARLERSVNRVSRTAYVTEVALALVGTCAAGLGMYLLAHEQRRRRIAEAGLREVNRELETRVKERTRELETARAQIGAFAVRLDRGIEAERRRLAREVHDQLGQLLTALRMTWSTLGDRYSVERRDRSLLDELLLDGIGVIRRITAQLRPPLLDQLGLSDAVAFRCDAFHDETGIACEADLTGTEALDAEQATQLFRIVQEALTNVARHSQAARAWIRGRRIDHHYELVVEDDGRGMGELRHGSFGMPNMRERAALAGGQLELGPSERGGLQVRVVVPLAGGDV